MPQDSFSYEARDRSGNTVVGQAQADSRQALARQLREQDLTVLSVTEAGDRPGPGRRSAIGGKVPLALLAQFYRQFATMIGSGMTVIQSLHTLDETMQHPTLRWAIRGALGGVERGQRLSDQMRRFPEVFSPLAVAVVAAGERGGRLEEMLKALADYAERDLEIQRMVNRETFYPKVLLVAILTIVPGGISVAMGIMGGAAAGFRMAGTILLLYLLAIVLPVLIIRALIRAYGSSRQGRAAIDRLKLAVPLFGALINRIAMSRFCRALGALYSAGVPMVEGVRLSAATTGNAALADAITTTVPHLEKGGRLSEALATSGLIPTMVLSMLRTGEQTGNIDQVLHKVADYYEDESRTKIHQLSVTIVPICVIIAGLVVLGIAASFYLQYFGAILTGAG